MTDTISMTGLCPPLTRGRYRIRITDRRTGNMVAEPPPQLVKGRFNRKLDAVSDAEITVNLAQTVNQAERSACCEQLGRVAEWGHELSFWREGDDEPAWIGPIVATEASSSAIGFQALDRAAWWYRRAVRFDHNYLGWDAADVFLDLITNDADYRDPCGLLLVPRRTGVAIIKVLLAADHENIGTVVDDLSSSALDWTISGARAFVGGAVNGINIPGTIEMSHWIEPPVVRRDGKQLVSTVSVLGTSVRGVWPNDYPPFNNSPVGFYGLHFGKVSDQNLQGATEATARAKSLYEMYYQPVITIISNSGLGSRAWMPLEALIPGNVYQLRAPPTCIDLGVGIAMRLTVVDVDIEGGAEIAVKPTFSPIGTENQDNLL